MDKKLVDDMEDIRLGRKTIDDVRKQKIVKKDMTFCHVMIKKGHFTKGRKSDSICIEGKQTQIPNVSFV